MEYIKIRLGGDFDQLGTRLEKTVEDFFRAANPMFSVSERSWKPQMDVYESRDAIVLLAEIAGVDKENLEVEINNRAVRIYGHRLNTPPAENVTYRLAEIPYGRFERILLLPKPIDPGNVTATYVNGFLKIEMAKLPLDRTHKIEITEA